MSELIRWQRSRRSEGGNCVEVARTPVQVWVRDSKLGDDSPRLSFTLRAWRQFLAGLQEADRG